MVLTNRERQARYRERLKSQAAVAAGLSEAMTELLMGHRDRIAMLDEQLRQMRSYKAGGHGFGTHSHAKGDTTDESIARAEAERAQLLALIQKHDPDGLTAASGVQPLTE